MTSTVHKRIRNTQVLIATVILASFALFILLVVSLVSVFEAEGPALVEQFLEGVSIIGRAWRGQ